MSDLIVVEGLDGFGKTTVAKAVAERMGATYIKADHCQFKSLPPEVVQQMHPMRRFLFYLSGYSDVSETVRQADDVTFVTDRYTTSMCVYNGKLAGKELQDLITEFDLVEPTHVFHLIGNEEDRWDRINDRKTQQPSDWDLKIQKDAQVRKDLKARYAQHCQDFPKIVSTGRSVDEVVNEVVDYVLGNFVDLHIHSSVVDGDMTPEEIEMSFVNFSNNRF